VNAQKQKRVVEERKKDDLEEESNSLQKGQRDLLARHGRLKGEEEVTKEVYSPRNLQRVSFRKINVAYRSVNSQFVKWENCLVSKDTTIHR